MRCRVAGRVAALRAAEPAKAVGQLGGGAGPPGTVAAPANQLGLPFGLAVDQERQAGSALCAADDRQQLLLRVVVATEHEDERSGPACAGVGAYLLGGADLRRIAKGGEDAEHSDDNIVVCERDQSHGLGAHRAAQ
jgi:hypothetical protein